MLWINEEPCKIRHQSAALSTTVHQSWCNIIFWMYRAFSSSSWWLCIANVARVRGMKMKHSCLWLEDDRWERGRYPASWHITMGARHDWQLSIIILLFINHFETKYRYTCCGAADGLVLDSWWWTSVMLNVTTYRRRFQHGSSLWLANNDRAMAVRHTFFANQWSE